MPKIQILPPHIVNRIAAGEVVERPASVVKELVENALDAKATRIDVEAGEGGRYIRVADNGSGMTAEDAAMAFYNHATSKITEASDLSQIVTLGFRGEALASVASISRMTCLTRQANAEIGCKIILNELGEPQTSSVGCSVGTVMEVRDLFYNTPARLKFLKRPQTEMSHIEETLQYLALSHPEVQFSLTVQGQTVLKTSGSDSLEICIEEVFHFHRDGISLIPVGNQDEEVGLSISGYIATPGVTKSSKKWCVTFVNGRSIRCPLVGKAVEYAYESLIPHGKYPISILFLTLPSAELDVNVHPTKREVRYAQGNTVFSFVKCSLSNTLEAQGFFAMPNPPAFEPRSGGYPQPVQLNSLGIPAPLSRPSWQNASYPSSGGFVGNSERPEYREASLSFYQALPETEAPSDVSLSQFKVIGQLFNTYILLETVQGLMVVDQHIASERTFFERLSHQILEPTPHVQALLIPHQLDITPAQQELLTSAKDAFGQLGFNYELLPEGHAALYSIPILYQEREPEGLFLSLLRRFEETGELKLDLDHLIATLSCHSAVRAGDTLTTYEMEQVVEQWLACRLPWTCPHGRPIAHTISTQELNQFFHRPSLPVNAF